MIDFHTHLLPGIDDGSPNLEVTAGLLEQERAQGVDTVVATPHFYADQTSVDRFLDKRSAALDAVVSAGLTGDLTILPAAEVYYFPGMSKAQRLDELCLSGSRILLLEMPFGQWTDKVVREVEEMIRQRDLAIVLAHIERFYAFQKDRHPMDALLSLPLYLQVNAGSVASWGERRALKKAFALHKPMILGSDCHSLHRRPVNLSEGIAWFDKHIAPDCSAKMQENARQLLEMRN